MRSLLVVAAALSLAACSVDLEGAACEVPGSSAQCPSGQRCGNDLRCSDRAAACTAQCAAGERRCVDGDVRTCTDADPVCGTWALAVGCADGLVCRGEGAEAACFCPDNAGPEVVVDAVAGAPAGAPAPTGVRTPAACRFPTLAQGLAAAAGLPGAVVVAAGEPATYPVTAPLAVPAGVTLRGDDDPPAPASRVLSLEGDLSAGVILAEGASLSGFTVRNASAAAAAVGVEVACAAGQAARVEDVAVEARGEATALAAGVRVGGACPVELARVTVGGASGAGLLVARDAGDATVRVADAVLDGNGKGAQLTRGDLTLLRTVVRGSAGTGVEVSGGPEARLTVEACKVGGNGDTGVVVQSDTGRFRLLRSRVCGNGALADRGAPYAARKVGGLYLYGNPPADLAFAGNALFGNGGDQVLVASAGVWALDGAPPEATACGPDANLFAGYAASYVGVYAATDATVGALWNAWRGNQAPKLGTDYVGKVDAGQTYDPARFCLIADPLVCD